MQSHKTTDTVNHFDIFIKSLLDETYTTSPHTTYDKSSILTGGYVNADSNANSNANADPDETKKKLKKLEKKVTEKGLSFWFDKEGKMLVKEKKHNDGYNKMLKIIKKNMKEYDGKEIVSVNIFFLPKNIGKKYTEDNEMGVIKIDIYVHTGAIIDYDEKLINIVMRNEKNSILTLYYRESEISDFKLQHIKILADALITNKIKKTNMLKFYHLEDLDKYLNI